MPYVERLNYFIDLGANFFLGKLIYAGTYTKEEVVVINYMTVADVAKELGVTAPQIRYAHVSGRVVDPEWHHGRRAYKDADIERLRQYFESKKWVF